MGNGSIIGVDPDENEKKRSEETQTLHTGCSKAEPKKIRPAADPFPGSRDGQNLISWRQTQFCEDRCTQFRVIVVTGPPPTPHTHTHPLAVANHLQDGGACVEVPARCSPSLSG